jgi:hypothetical protein
LSFAQLTLTVGDLTGDGDLNIADIVRTVETVLELGDPASEYETWAADVNADDVVNIEDIVMMVGMILDDVFCNEDQYGCYTDNLACCVRTTSHEFEWEVLHIGEGTTNQLNDVWIFDNGHIWCVGRFYINDETYSAAIWDGESWQYKQLYRPYQQSFWIETNIRCIWGFSEDEIWFTTAGTVVRYTGNDTLEVMDGYPVSEPPGYSMLWAASLDNIYFADPWNGYLGYYDGDEFYDEDTGIQVPFLDIWGVQYPDSGETTVWVGGREGFDTILMVNHGNGWQIIANQDYYPAHEDSITSLVKSIWTSPYSSLYITTAAGIYKALHNTEGEAELVYTYPIFSAIIKRIRGNSDNDIFISGLDADLRHFNGETWHTYDELRDENADILGLAVNGDIVVAVGWRYQEFLHDQAVIIKGTRVTE